MTRNKKREKWKIMKRENVKKVQKKSRTRKNYIKQNERKESTEKRP